MSRPAVSVIRRAMSARNAAPTIQARAESSRGNQIRSPSSCGRSLRRRARATAARTARARCRPRRARAASDGQSVAVAEVPASSEQRALVLPLLDGRRVESRQPQQQAGEQQDRDREHHLPAAQEGSSLEKVADTRSIFAIAGQVRVDGSRSVGHGRRPRRRCRQSRARPRRSRARSARPAGPAERGRGGAFVRDRIRVRPRGAAARRSGDGPRRHIAPLRRSREAWSWRPSSAPECCVVVRLRRRERVAERECTRVAGGRGRPHGGLVHDCGSVDTGASSRQEAPDTVARVAASADERSAARPSTRAARTRAPSLSTGDAVAPISPRVRRRSSGTISATRRRTTSSSFGTAHGSSPPRRRRRAWTFRGAGRTTASGSRCGRRIRSSSGPSSTVGAAAGRW